MSLLQVEGLRIELSDGTADVVDEIAFEIQAGEILGLVGESGSGKSTVGLALLGFVRRGMRFSGGSVRIGDVDMLGLGKRDLRRARGELIAYIPQDPAAALNPALRISQQLAERLLIEESLSSKALDGKVREGLREVRLPDDSEFLRRYPHQLSGGQQQRVAIAMAFMCSPRIIVLDEPTTGLDVTTQAHILQTVKELCVRRNVSALYISHDLAVVANLAHRVGVMYAGRLVELGRSSVLYSRPAHPYTRQLIAAIPDVAARKELESIPGQAPAPGSRPEGCFFEPRCSYRVDICRVSFPPPIDVSPDHSSRCHRAIEVVAESRVSDALAIPRLVQGETAILSVRDIHASYGDRPLLHEVSFDLAGQECLALVGESGSGKTTLARCIIGLHDLWTGEIKLNGEVLPQICRARPLHARRELQYVFQSPYNSLNPRKTVEEILSTPAKHFFGLKGQALVTRLVECLDQVALGPQTATKYPSQLSGGERQRVAIARALICEPEVLICDEITSSLDVSVQAAIVALLDKLRRERQLSLIFVTHNLALVRGIADRVIVLQQGRVVEMGQTDDILDSPRELYTKELLRNTPRLEAV